MPDDSTPSESIQDLLPDEVLNNTVDYPVADYGHGEHRATLRISQQVESGDVLKDVLRAMSRSAAETRIEVVFGASTPPPILVTLKDVAYCLAVTEDYAKELVKHGWLTPIHFRGSDDPTVRYARAEAALKHGRWAGWEVRFLWAELVSLAQWMRENGRVPSYEPPGRRRTLIPTSGKGWLIKSTAAVTRQVLREAKNEDGSQQYLATHEIVKRVQEAMPYKQVAYKTVGDALRQCVDHGLARKKYYKATFRSGKGAAYRWLPDRERAMATFDVRHERPPQGDEPDEIVGRGDQKPLDS